MGAEHIRAWAIPASAVEGRRPSELMQGASLWLRDVSAPGALPRYVLLDRERRIASPEECLLHYGALLRNPQAYLMVLEEDGESFYRIVDWPLDFRKSVRRLVYCVTLMKVPARPTL